MNEGKQMYKSVTNLYLFWKQYQGYSRWYVGKTQGDDQNVLAFIDSNVNTPDKVPRHLNWMELQGSNSKEWTPNQQFVVTEGSEVTDKTKTQQGNQGGLTSNIR